MQQCAVEQDLGGLRVDDDERLVLLQPVQHDAAEAGDQRRVLDDERREEVRRVRGRRDAAGVIDDVLRDVRRQRSGACGRDGDDEDEQPLERQLLSTQPLEELFH